MSLSSLPMYNKADVACWPITRAIGPDLEKQLKRLFVFNSGKSVIFSTVNGDVYALGANPTGILGTGQNVASNAPTKLAGLKNIPVEFAAGVHGLSGPRFVVAVSDAGSLYNWGDNSSYCLGQGHGNTPVQAPTLIQQGIKITQVSCGYYFTLALSDKGQVYSWGYNGHNELGNGSTTNSSIPIQVKGELETQKCVKVCCGQYTSYALTEEGKIYSWGYSNNGQVGNGFVGNHSLPQLIKVQTVFTSIAAGLYHALAIDDCGHLYSWGSNDNGELGDGSTSQRNLPVHHKAYSFVEVAAHHSLRLSAALSASGKVFVWGQTALEDYNKPFETILRSLDEVFSVYGNGTMYRTLKIDNDPPKISETINQQLNNKATADVEFIASGKSIHAHKFILSLRCEYFRTMFSGDWQESRDGIVKISFPYEVFHAFIVYLYTDEIHIKLEHVVGLLELSQQYMDWDLKRRLEDLIRAQLNTDNVADFYGVATQFEAKTLAHSCVKYTAGHMKDVVSSEGFKKLKSDVSQVFVSSLAQYDVFKT